MTKDIEPHNIHVPQARLYVKGVITHPLQRIGLVRDTIARTQKDNFAAFRSIFRPASPNLHQTITFGVDTHDVDHTEPPARFFSE